MTWVVPVLSCADQVDRSRRAGWLTRAGHGYGYVVWCKQAFSLGPARQIGRPFVSSAFTFLRPHVLGSWDISKHDYPGELCLLAADLSRRAAVVREVGGYVELM